MRAWVGAAGHSLGEFAALVAAGVLSFPDALRIVAVRGREMQRAGEERPGTMSALLGVGAEDAAALCDEARGDDVLLVANENSPQQVVISGSVAAIERAEALCAERKIRAVRLRRRRRVPLAVDGAGGGAAARGASTPRRSRRRGSPSRRT